MKLVCRGKTQAEIILDSLKKIMPKIVKPEAKCDSVMCEWEAAFEVLTTKGYFTPGLNWRPFPNTSPPPPTNTQHTSRNVVERSVHEVPGVLHPNWTKKDRQRAEVYIICSLYT